MATFPTNVLCNYFVKIDFREDSLGALHVIRQCFTKSLIWIETQMPLGYASMTASILYNLTKNLTVNLTHNLCAVLPKPF